MKRTAALALALGDLSSSSAETAGRLALTAEDIRAVSPALEQYAEKTIVGDLWQRSDLSPRDRSIVTVAALITRNQTIEFAASHQSGA